MILQNAENDKPEIISRVVKYVTYILILQKVNFSEGF